MSPKPRIVNAAFFKEGRSSLSEASVGMCPEELIDAIGEAERLKASLWGRLYAEGSPREHEEDRLLDVKEASLRLSISTDTLYRKAADLPFTVRIGGNVRFSAQGISRFIATRQGR